MSELEKAMSILDPVCSPFRVTGETPRSGLKRVHANVPLMISDQ